MNLVIRTTAKQMDVELEYKKADNHDKAKKKHNIKGKHNSFPFYFMMDCLYLHHVNLSVSLIVLILKNFVV